MLGIEPVLVSDQRLNDARTHSRTRQFYIHSTGSSLSILVVRVCASARGRACAYLIAALVALCNPMYVYVGLR